MRVGVRPQNIEVWIHHEFNLRFAEVLMTSAFINNNIGSLSEEERTRRWPVFAENFQKACGTEKGFFGLATPSVFPTYNIVSNGTYKIRSYRTGNRYLVASGSSVTTQANDPGEYGTVRDELVLTPSTAMLILTTVESDKWC